MLIGNQTPSPDLSVSEKSCDGVTWYILWHFFALSSRLSELTFPKVLTPHPLLLFSNEFLGNG